MGIRLRRRSVYLATIVAMVSVAAGFGMAATVNAHSQAAQGDFTSVTSGVTGVTYSSAVLSAIPSPAPSASTGTGVSPQTLSVGANAFCASPTCTTGNPAEVVTYNFGIAFSGNIQITYTVNAATNGGSTTVFLAAPALSGTIVLYWDLGSGSNTLTSVSAVVQQCSSSCP